MKLILSIILSIFMIIGSTQYAFADLIIWQVEANPQGTDSGNEWLTVLNTGSEQTLDDYLVRSTHGRIATELIPNITLDNCEYYKVTFSKQAIDNRDEIMTLVKSGKIIYETPILKDVKNDDRIWTNSEGSLCSDHKQVLPIKATIQSKPEPKISYDLEEKTYEIDSKQSRINELEKENAKLKQIIFNLKSQLKSIMTFLNNFD